MKDSNNELEELLKDYDATDIIIIGGGPAGLMVAADLVKLDLKILVIEKNSYIREKLWANNIVYNPPILLGTLKEILNEFKVSYQKDKTGAYIIDSLNVRSKIISEVYDKGVKISDTAEFSNLIYNGEKVEGVVLSWPPPLYAQGESGNAATATLKCHVVVDATGTDAYVYEALKKKNIIKQHVCGQADVCASGELLIRQSGQVYPGVFAAGMAVATIYRIPQIELTLGSLLLSGRKVAQEVEMFFAENFIMPPKKS